MKRPWHRQRPALVKEVQEDIEGFCSTLHVFVEDDVVRIRGTFPVRHEGEELDRYAIVVEFPENYPDELPILREVAGRIPWTANRHVYTNGTACVLLPEERWWSFPPDKSFLGYLKGPLHNYFLGQSIVAAGGNWPFGEHGHGLNGVIDFYADQFGTKDAKTIVQLLQLVAEGRFKGHWLCPCGSGDKIRNCHPEAIAVARKMPPWAARRSLDRIFAAVKTNSRTA